MAAYAKTETPTFQLTVIDGDEHGCAYHPLTMTWKGKPIPYAKASRIETASYDAKITVWLSSPRDRGHRNGDPGDESIWDEMEAAGIKLEGRR